MLKTSKSDVSDDRSPKEVYEKTLDTLHLGVVLEDGAGEEEAGLRFGGDLLVDEILKPLEVTDAEFDHVEDVLVKSAADDLKCSNINFNIVFATEDQDQIPTIISKVVPKNVPAILTLGKNEKTSERLNHKYWLKVYVTPS